MKFGEIKKVLLKIPSAELDILLYRYIKYLKSLFNNISKRNVCLSAIKLKRTN